MVDDAIQLAHDSFQVILLKHEIDGWIFSACSFDAKKIDRQQIIVDIFLAPRRSPVECFDLSAEDVSNVSQIKSM